MYVSMSGYTVPYLLVRISCLRNRGVELAERTDALMATRRVAETNRLSRDYEATDGAVGDAGSDEAEVRERAAGDVGLENGPTENSGDTNHCPICLSALSNWVDTNCGHTFCAECLLSYWRHDQWPLPARCAVCRTPVS